VSTPTPAEALRKQRHVSFTAAWCEEYLKHFGRKYVHQGAKDGSALKSFLGHAEDVTEEEWRRVMNCTWIAKDKFLRENCVTIAMLTCMWGKAVVQAGSTNPAHKIDSEYPGTFAPADDLPW